jgi:serine/threonine-protein kinase ULK4
VNKLSTDLNTIDVTNVLSLIQARGNLRCISPELLLLEGVHSYASDLWSLGCLLFELNTGRHPFITSSNPDENIVVTGIKLNDPFNDLRSTDIIPNSISNNIPANSRFKMGNILKDLLQGLLEKSPLDRFSW